MKELSIEEKARAYDEALERAKNYWKSPRTCFDIDVLTEIFSELKDTDDAIRKELIEYFEHYSGGDNISIKFPEWIAWLKKQGENNSVIEMKSPEESLGISSKEYNEIVNNCLYSESKPNGKIEPKFHEGDWLISNNKKSIYQVIEVKRGIYVVRDNADNHEYHIGIEESEKSGRLWTIQDAKDGDVLYSPSHRLVWIYKDKEHYYTCVNMNYVTENVATDGLISVPNDTCPATKDERTILFEKIKEAGYELDAEKKELKKVEQLP